MEGFLGGFHGKEAIIKVAGIHGHEYIHTVKNIGRGVTLKNFI